MASSDTSVYDDGRVRVDDDAVTLRRYYFPLGTAKKLPYDSIARVDVVELGVSGRYRLWGSSDFVRWFPLEVGRYRKTTGVVLTTTGATRITPACTPDDPERVAALIRAHLTT